MAKRRGFFAEMQYQAAVAERNRQREQAAAVRDQQRRQREAERARAAAERAQAAAARGDAKARAEAEREARRLNVAAQEAEVESRNGHLQSLLADIDDVLNFTLSIDDFVELEALRQSVEHREFKSAHETPIPAPTPIPVPKEPNFYEPPAPTGLGGIFKKKAHATAVAKARSQFEEQHNGWRAAVAALPVRQFQQIQEHQAAESERAERLAADQAAYDEECRQREADIVDTNARLDSLIARRQAGQKEAVEEYFGIVFGNSVYPEGVTVDVEQSYKLSDKELEVALSLPSPGDIPAVKAYKYVKARDEITETSQTVKEQRERYNGLVNAIVLRTLHEVWESDRLGHVNTISLIAAVEHIDPATGRQVATPVAAVAVHRAEFESFDLGNVTPAETLRHLKAVVSSNAHELKAVDLSAGVRG